MTKNTNILIGSVERFANEQGLRMRIEAAITSLNPSFPDNVTERVMAMPIYRNDQFGIYGRCKRTLIELAGRLFLPENAAELKQTFIHEIGHAMSSRIYNVGGHGIPWRKCMTALGSWPEPVHSVLVDWKMAPIVYVCNTCGYLCPRSKRWQHVRIFPDGNAYQSIDKSVPHPTLTAYSHRPCGKESRFVLFSAKGVLTDQGVALRHKVVEPASCKGEK